MAHARDFRLRLGLLAVGGFGVRLAYSFAIAEDLPQAGDSLVYRQLAWQLANGFGYADVPSVASGEPVPTAQHPPLFPLFLSAWTRVGLGGEVGHRVACACLGALTVGLVGLVGRRVGGPAVGLVAAGLAAVYPLLVMGDGSLISESLYVSLIALALLLAYRLLDRPTPLAAAGLGATLGLATLTRSDAVLLLPLLAVPVAWRAGRARALTVSLLAAALVLAPWLGRNWVQLERFPLLSTNSGFTALAANCDATYYSEDLLGFVSHPCAATSSCLRLRSEVEESECLQREATTYARDHARRVPLVALARVQRLWEVYDPSASLDYGENWARPKGLATAGLIFYVCVVVLALAGAFLVRRRGVPLLPLMATFALVTIVAALTFGVTRYRAAAEPALLILAAASLEQLGRTLLGRRARGRLSAARARTPGSRARPRAGAGR